MMMRLNKNPPIWVQALTEGVLFGLVAVLVAAYTGHDRHRGLLVPGIVEGAMFGLLMGCYHLWRKHHPRDDE